MNRTDDYKRWLTTCSCVDCGARYADRKRDDRGVALDMWATETQCWTCFVAFGAPGKRGKPSSMDLAREHGLAV